VRSLHVLLNFLREFKTALRPFVERVHAALLPLLAHEDDDVRELAATVLASCTLVQSGTAAAAAAKKKELAAKAATASTSADGVDDDLAAEDEARASSLAVQAQSNRLVIPDDPWSVLLQSTCNTLHVRMDELDEAGDGAAYGADRPWTLLPRCTEEQLALPALPTPANSASAPFARAHAMQLQLSGLFELLSALLSPELFARMQTNVAGSVTVAVPVQHLLALLRRFVAQDINPHTLQHITGRALPRAGLLLLRAATLERAIDLLEDLMELAGPSLAPFVGQIGELIKDLLARCAFVEQGKEQRHALPRLVPRLYQASSALLRRFGPGALLYPFLLPLLSTALVDIERPVRLKNLQLQLQRNLSSMAAFTGASNKDKRQSGGGSSNAAGKDADPSALFLESAHVDLASVIGCAGLEFLNAALVSSGSAMPLQKRVQVDRSLVSLALALQAGSWSIVDSFRLGVYECLLASMTTPASAAAVARASGSHVGGGAANSSTGANGLLSAFALLPYAVQLFTHAARHDRSAAVSALASQALRVSASLVHPRAFALQAHASAFVQDMSLAPLGEGEDGGALDLQAADDSANRLAPGLVRGRDGSLYMRMQEQETVEPVPQSADNEEGSVEARSQEVNHAQSSVPSAAAAAAPRVGQKRGRDSDAEEQPTSAMQLDRDEEDDNAAVVQPAAKRAHVDTDMAAVPIASAVAAAPAPAATASTEAPASSATLPPAGTLETRPDGAADDAAELAAAAVDEGDDGDEGADVAVVDDGPDEDEAAQGSLWSL
jgi:hypothetical protein